MSDLLGRLRKGYGKKLRALHTWNGWIVVILALTGLVLVGGFWRGFLGEGRVWIKGLHIVVGIASILPVIYYLLLASKHWKQLKENLGSGSMYLLCSSCCLGGSFLVYCYGSFVR